MLATCFCIAAALGLAVWSIYWDLGRRTRGAASAGLPASEGRPRGERRGLLIGALAMMATAWVLDYLANRWGAWLEAGAVLALAAGLVLLGIHLTRPLRANAGEIGEGR